ncbi:MAG: hypothetical protein ACYTG6_07770 [Planctomycetota bacterium]|jgi:hypothetical protein
MQQALIALVVGLVAGAAGAYLFDLARNDASGGGRSEPLGDARGRQELLERLDALEARLPLVTASGGTTLQGRAEPPSEGALTPTAEEALAARLEARLEARMEEKWEELAATQEEGGGEEERGSSRRRLPLAEVAVEMGLSGSEEDALRRIYRDTQDKMLALFAEPDQTVDDLRRELEAAIEDPSKQQALMAKYLPKMMPKLGDLMAIELDKENQIQELLGAERAAELGHYNIVEERPFGFGGDMRFEAGTTRR